MIKQNPIYHSILISAWISPFFFKTLITMLNHAITPKTQCTTPLSNIVHYTSSEPRFMLIYKLIIQGFLMLLLKLCIQLLFLLKKKKKKFCLNTVHDATTIWQTKGMVLYWWWYFSSDINTHHIFNPLYVVKLHTANFCTLVFNNIIYYNNIHIIKFTLFIIYLLYLYMHYIFIIFYLYYIYYIIIFIFIILYIYLLYSLYILYIYLLYIFIIYLYYKWYVQYYLYT